MPYTNTRTSLVLFNSFYSIANQFLPEHIKVFLQLYFLILQSKHRPKRLNFTLVIFFSTLCGVSGVIPGIFSVPTALLA